MQRIISVPPNFNFKRTALSHGWYDLPPFYLDTDSWTLTRVLNIGSRVPVSTTISAADGGLRVEAPGRLATRATENLINQVRHMLRLDEELTEFYSALSDEPRLKWVGASGAGRLLRSPTVFEDLVKTICTTNCTWALTRKMIEGLVSAGPTTADGWPAFPTAEVLAEKPLRFFVDKVRAGYRAPYLRELAAKVVKGDLDPEAWLTSDLRTPQLKREMKQVKGVGDYAAENLLRLIGRYDVLALDSWVRAQFAATRNGARKASDKKIDRHYSRFGKWKGLVLWCDMTCDWLTPDE
jgi:N-glycosylase/DNA lyase